MSDEAQDKAKRLELTHRINFVRRRQEFGLRAIRDAADVAAKQVQSILLDKIPDGEKSPSLAGQVFELLIQVVPFGAAAKVLGVDKFFQGTLDSVLQSRFALRALPKSTLGREVMDIVEGLPKGAPRKDFSKWFLQDPDYLALYSAGIRDFHKKPKVPGAAKSLAKSLVTKGGGAVDKKQGLELDSPAVAVVREANETVREQMLSQATMWDTIKTTLQFGEDVDVQTLEGWVARAEWMDKHRAGTVDPDALSMSYELYIWRLCFPRLDLSNHFKKLGTGERILWASPLMFYFVGRWMSKYSDYFGGLPLAYESYMYDRFGPMFETGGQFLAKEHRFRKLQRAWDASARELHQRVKPVLER